GHTDCCPRSGARCRMKKSARKILVTSLFALTLVPRAARADSFTISTGSLDIQLYRTLGQIGGNGQLATLPLPPPVGFVFSGGFDLSNDPPALGFTCPNGCAAGSVMSLAADL